MKKPARYLFYIDRPTDWEKPVRTLYVSGWCLAKSGKPITAMRAKIGRSLIQANFDLERPDLPSHFPELPLAAKGGFAVAVPLLKSKSLLSLEVRSDADEWQQFFAHDVPAASLSATPEEVFGMPGVSYYPVTSPGYSRFQFWMDRPADWSRKIRYLRATGWCLATSGQPVTAVRARLRGKVYKARYGGVRPDVALTFSQHPNALRSGFSLDAVVPRGPVTISFEAQSNEGPWEPFFSQRITGPYFREEADPTREEVGDYATWIRNVDRLRGEDRRLIRQHIATFAERPLISVLMPVYNSNVKHLRRAIESVRKQLYENWELCLVDDASTDAAIWPLLEKASHHDARIKIHRRSENGHISAASNDALSLATGSYVAFLDHDDELSSAALYHVAYELQRNPDLQLLYSDEDKLDKQGRRADPYFKPDWSPDLFLGQNYISHLSVLNAELVRRVGGFRVGFEGSQDYDLILRCLEQISPAQIRHIPHILYHWRAEESSTASAIDVKPYAQAAALRAVEEHLDRQGLNATATEGYVSYLRVSYTIPNESPLVSIIIPTRDRMELLRKCLLSILEKTQYPNYEIVILDNESVEPETQRYLNSLKGNSRVRTIRVDGAFNYSRLNNIGADAASGTYLLFLNNDIDVKNASWLDEMIGQGLRPEVGAVGARLWYPEEKIQHAGVILGAGGIANHAHMGLRFEHGYFARAHLVQNFSAVTGACLLTKKQLYSELGGFDEVNLPVAFNDVDYCLRLREAGYWVVWTPYAELYHHESATRGFDDSSSKQVRFLAETNYMRSRWNEVLTHDPFYNPNLSLGENLFTLAYHPRVTKPWRKVAQPPQSTA